MAKIGQHTRPLLQEPRVHPTCQTRHSRQLAIIYQCFAAFLKVDHLAICAPSAKQSCSTQTFSQSFNPKNRYRGPGPLSSLASTAAPFESKTCAAVTSPWGAAQNSGVQPQALSPGPPGAVASGGRRLKRPRPRRRRKLSRSNDKRTMNVLDSTSSNMFNAKKYRKHTQQVSAHFPHN